MHSPDYTDTDVNRTIWSGRETFRIGLSKNLFRKWKGVV